MIQRRVKTFGRGVHPPEHKDATKDLAVKRLGFAPELVVPLLQHLGAPARPIVRKGQEVVRGEPIAAPGGFVSVPMHAPATGVVARIDKAVTATGHMAPAIIIKPYPGSTQQILYTGEADIDAMTPEQIVAAVQDTGMVGLGGAAFPTHVKMAVPQGKTVDTVIANGCECEPYLTTDHRLMLEQHENLFRGIAIALKATGAREAIIGIEDNKPDVIDALRAKLNGNAPIRVEPVKTKYPQGAEKMLIKALLRREVPSGGLPVDVHVGVFNVATLAQLAELMPRRRGLIERIVTITGPGVQKPGNYLVPLGTPLRYIFDQVGLNRDARQIILGGPMMGLSVASLDVPVTKGVSGIIVLTEEETAARPNKIYPCIKCGQCVEACPVSLNPSLMGDMARRREYKRMEDQYHLNDCFECACCTYVCPSNIPLVQYFRVAKALNREKKAPANG
ncbi:MAG: electron transport complex subunit RsxC [Candidatus Hydrogenedentes bacterium]|nr:electron transport complex subunit RsxC [Candidatus Hydrogenedentota bacterium]